MGFQRKVYTPPAPAPVRPAVRAGSYSAPPPAAPVNKQPRLQNPHLRLMMRKPGLSCLLRVPGVCKGARDDTCGCHGNSSQYNKGGHHKAHDFFMVRGCARCHAWLDSSHVATGEERAEAFRIGLNRQIAEWRSLADAPGVDNIDRAAIRWALVNLGERGYT